MDFFNFLSTSSIGKSMDFFFREASSIGGGGRIKNGKAHLLKNRPGCPEVAGFCYFCIITIRYP